MAKSGSKYLKIKIDTETGKIVKKVDGDQDPATPVSQEEINQIYQNQGFKHVATILHAHASPGCAYLNIGGWWFKVCFQL